MKYKNLKYDLVVCGFLTIISLFVIYPFMNKGFFPTHDGEWAVVRLTDMYRQLKDFQIPPRFSGNLNFGYGYPLFNFAYPFPYYLGIVVHLLGFGFVDSIKVLFALSVPLSAIGIYFLSKAVWENRLSGVISSIFYLFLPYRFVDLYVRGSIGESLSFIFFPLIMLSVFKILRRSYTPFFVLLLAISTSSLVMTHNIMTVLFFPVIFIFLISLLVFKKNYAFYLGAIGIIFGILISSFFWLPALAEKNNILLSKVPIADRSLYFVSLNQLIFPSWGYGTPTESNSFSYQLGYPHIIVFLISIAVSVYFLFKKKEKLSAVALILVFIICGYITMLFSFTEKIWQVIPLLSEINYPWTMLAPIGFLISFLSGYLAKYNKLIVVLFILSIAAVVTFYPYAKPKEYFDKGDNYYLTNDATTTSSNELMPLWVKEKPDLRVENKVEISSANGEISNLFYNSKLISFDTKLNKDTNIIINTIYYPGWKSYADGNELSIYYNNDRGIMNIQVPKDTKKIKLYFTETELRSFANILSLIGLILTFCFPFIYKSLVIKITAGKS